MTEQVKCLIYARMDANKMDAHTALKAQEMELRDFAAKAGYEVVGIVSDIGPAWNMERPGLIDMMRAAEEKKFQILLVRDVDRLSRDTLDTIQIFTFLLENGIEIRTTAGTVENLVFLHFSNAFVKGLIR